MAKAGKPRETFYEVLNAAIADLMEFGFDSQSRVDEWVLKLEVATRHSLVSEAELHKSVREALIEAYQRTVESGMLARRHEGISEFTLARIRPKLRDELDRRILASTDLIRLNSEGSIQRTLQRFQGWATSIPVGGTRVAERAKVRKTIRKSMAGLPFEERRVIIDQSHKLVATINELVAKDGDAIAGIWRHVREGGGYQARPEHLDRHGHIFVIRDNWALRDGLMKLAGRQYTDQVTAPGEEPYCRCHLEYVYHLRDLPEEMLTVKGKKWLANAQLRLSGWTDFQHGAMRP